MIKNKSVINDDFGKLNIDYFLNDINSTIQLMRDSKYLVK